MSSYYLIPENDELDRVPELQVCIAEALYDIESVMADPGAHTKEELKIIRDQIVSNLERAWAITGGSEDQLTGTMVQISQVVVRGLDGNG